MSISPLYRPSETLICAGCPTTASDFLQVSQDFGCSTVINLRAPSEDPGRSFADEVAAAGMKYVHIPISSPADFNEENARQLRDSLDTDGKTFVFCGSSNRVGGLFALKTYLFDDKSFEESIQFGEAAGMTHIKPTIETILRGIKK